MTKKDEEETFNEKKPLELQWELEKAYKPGKWWYKLLRKIGWFFGLE